MMCCAQRRRPGPYDRTQTGHDLARRTDPSSSRIAAEQHTQSGKRSSHRDIALQLVRQYSGQTFRELWDLMCADHREIFRTPEELMRRLGDLRRDGLLEHGLARQCTKTGHLMLTWWAKT